MKSVASLLLAVLLLLSLVACGQGAERQPTLGQALLQDFQTRVKDSPQADLETLAQGLLDQEDLEFQGAVTPVEPGLLMGFGNETIRAFPRGDVCACHQHHSLCGLHLFRLEEQTSGQDFVQTLRDAADPGGISAPRPMRHGPAGDTSSSS